jgi:hypothetical protein
MATKYTREFLKPIVQRCNSMYAVFRELGLSPAGSNYCYIRRRIKECEIDISHFTGARWNVGIPSVDRLPADQILIYNRVGRREHISKLRRALVESGVLEICTVCGSLPKWMNKPLRLQIDHKDGDTLNNVKENLRFLCPNCHTQTGTYGASNIIVDGVFKKKSGSHVHRERKAKIEVSCFRCHAHLYVSKVKERHFCSYKCAQLSSEKIAWPSDEKLHEMVWKTPMTSIAKKLGVSACAIKKRCVKRGINTPGVGYWSNSSRSCAL